MNSTEANVGRPILERVHARQQELSKILAALPPDQRQLRSDIQLALDTVASLLPQDQATVPALLARDLSASLEDNKYLAETAGGGKLEAG